MKWLYLLLLITVTAFSFPTITTGQIYRMEAQHLNDVKVKVNNKELKSAWGGGMNHPQFSQADLNNDGVPDLVVYENEKYSPNAVKTFINMGTAGNPQYIYNPDYEYLFPVVRGYLKLMDYNGDNIPDLFHYGSKGMELCDGFYNNQNRLTFRNCRELGYNHPFAGKINIPVMNGDVPGLADVDNDGDLDILIYDILDNDLLLLFTNKCKEEGLPADVFKLVKTEGCWGKATPTYYQNREHRLGITCMFIPFAPDGSGGNTNSSNKTTGSGNHCITVMDVDGDGDFDLFDGYQDYAEIQLVLNGKSDFGYVRDSMFAQDTTWQSSGIKVDMPRLPVVYPVDVTTDGNMDLLISPYVDNSEDVKCVAYYKNTGTATNPVYTYEINDFVVGDMIDVGSGSYPVFYDFDKDGKKDLLIGSSKYDKANATNITQLSLFKNTSAGNNVSFELVTDNVANVSGANYGSIAPAIGDIDNDGLDDMIIGKLDGTLAFYRNYAVNNTLPPVWQLWQANITNKFGGIIDVGNKATPCFYDLDKDGKKDLIVGGSSGYLYYFHNDGTVPQELKLGPVTDKLGDVFVGTRSGTIEYEGYSAPFIGRVDNTPKDYLLVGNLLGVVARYDGVDAPYTSNKVFPRTDSIYSEIAIKGTYAAPVVVNLDEDTSMKEMYIGNQNGGLFYYRQLFYEGINETAAHPHRLYVYPNPAANELHISLEDIPIAPGTVVTVYGTTGQPVLNAKAEQGKKIITLNTANLPVGVYLCAVTVNGTRYSSVFVKK